MLVSVLVPLGVPDKTVERLAAPLKARGCEVRTFDTPTDDPAELARRLGEADVAVIANTPFPASVVQSDPHLKLVDVAFTGVDKVDLAACRVAGVTVCNCAGYADRSVAELALALALDVLRHVVAGDKAVRDGGTSAGLCGQELAGKRVGIVGTGHIGTATGALFRAVGCEVVGTARHENPKATAAGITFVGLDELLATSDVVSLHLPLTPETHHYLDAQRIAAMKPGAVLINCARGPVVDYDALASALKSGHVAGAGIDVFDTEPPIPSDAPILSAPHCTFTPHVGYLTSEALERRAETAFANIEAWLDGAPQNVQLAPNAAHGSSSNPL